MKLEVWQGAARRSRDRKLEDIIADMKVGVRRRDGPDATARHPSTSAARSSWPDMQKSTVEEQIETCNREIEKADSRE